MKLPELTTKLIAIIVGATLVLLLAVFGLSQWRKAHTEATERRVEQAQSGATVESAKDAIATQAAAAGREQASEEIARTNAEEIQNAEGAEVVVNPAVDAAGRRAICLRDANRNSPKCKLLRAPAP